VTSLQCKFNSAKYGNCNQNFQFVGIWHPTLKGILCTRASVDARDLKECHKVDLVEMIVEKCSRDDPNILQAPQAS